MRGGKDSLTNFPSPGKLQARTLDLEFPFFMTRTLVLFLAFSLCLARSLQADNVDDAIHAEMQQHPIPGLALEIIRNGKPAKIAGYGLANLEWSNAVTADTVFEIGSVSKQFTAAGILLLQQDGKLSVDDKLSKHIKEGVRQNSSLGC